ncbi:MAG TPA: MFS transporter [Candidatus Binataceae bacterium]|nr:MFS transporter [Candidatus Binataceae bacterium]
MSEPSKLSPYRWIIEILLLLLLVAQSLTWLAPAPILEEIKRGLGISLGSAGLIISIIALCIGVFSLLGAVVAERVGALRALVIGIWLMTAGQIASGYVPNFAALLACRVLEGIGYGIVISPPATLIMQWFGEGEWPYMNMINFSFGYVGLTAVFRFTPPLFAAVGSSWRSVLFWYGVGSAGVALLWTIFGRERRSAAASEPVAPQGEAAQRGSALAEVAKMRDVLLVAAGLFGGMWVFQIYTAFLPQYFRAYRDMTMLQASLMTQVLPLTGMFSAAIGGIGTGMTGLRKPFTWPVAISTLVGCAGAIIFPNPVWIRLSLILVGIGAAGSLAAITTMLMELPGMTPVRVGAAMGFVWAIGYFGAFVSPFLGGALAAHFGLRAVMLSFLVFQLLPIVTMYFLPETGPGKTRYEIAAAERAG